MAVNRTTTDPNGDTTSYTYNYQYDRVGDVLVDNVQLGDLASTSAATVALASNYDYNANRTSLWVNIGGSATISHDAVTGFTGGTDDFTNSYVFDALGNMTSVSQTSQSSGNGVTAKTAAFAYDGDSRLTGVNLAQGNQVASATYTYDADSELTGSTYVDGSGNPLAGYHWDYDADSRVSDSYSRNNSSSATPSTGYSGGNWGKTVYTYDCDSELKGTTYSSFANAPISNKSETYDSNGNRTNHGTAGAANRLLTDGIYNYTYDADGNRIARTNIATSAATYYQWNNANQLAAVSGSGGPATYLYDAFGRMVSQTENGVTQNFIYDGENIALVLNGSGQVIERNSTALPSIRSWPRRRSRPARAWPVR